MKVLLAADIFPPQSGGPATYVVALANALVAQGDEVSIVSLNQEGDTHVTRNTFHVAKGHKLKRYFSYIALLWKQAKGVDVVYAMGPVNAGLPALIISTLRRVPFAVKVVGDYAWEQGVQRSSDVPLDIDLFQQTKKLPKGVKFLRSIEQFVVSHADMVITPSQYLANMVKLWGAKHVSVVYNAVALSQVTEVKKPEKETWLVSVARLVPWKGMKTLIQMMETAPNDWKLHIIGDGPEKEPLAALAAGKEQVIVHGRKPREETVGYMKAADVVILNSGYEGLPHVLVEAGMVGTAVVASNKGGNPEVVSSEKQLFAYNNQAEIRAAIEYALAQKPGVKALVSFDEMISQTKNMLMDLCKHS